MLLMESRSRFQNGVLRFLWRQWSQLGVAADAEWQDRWLIDPEALLLLTLDVGRYDPRLFDEVLDWSVRNSRWLSVVRLGKIAAEQVGDTGRRLVAAFAEFMGEHGDPKRWRNLAGVTGGHSGEPIHLFLTSEGGTLPTIGAEDPTFARQGVLRPPVVLRGMSRTVPMDSPTNLLFKLRALFGVGTRPDALAYLLTHEQGYQTEIARRTSWSQSSLGNALGEIACSGLAAECPAPARERLYSADRARWRQFLRLRYLPTWVDWVRVTTGLSVITAFFREETTDQLTDYMLRSRLWTLTEVAGPRFTDTGLALRIGVHPGLSGSISYFRGFVERLVGALNPKPPRVR